MDKGFSQAIVLHTVACVFLRCVGAEGEVHIIFAALVRKCVKKQREKPENGLQFQIVKQIDDIGIRLL